jgi:undecaprenyl diphosphate synthase
VRELEPITSGELPGDERLEVRDGRAARYVAIIPDGNGRWAQARGLSVAEGHEAAAETLTSRVLDAIELGVKELTVYVFSTENWSRPAAEVAGLMGMFARRTPLEASELHRAGVRMSFIGSRARLSTELLREIRRAQFLTVGNEQMTLFLAFNYGGRAEILQAARSSGGANEMLFRRALSTSEMHDPELIIRTGGEQRLSNFLLWQAAYAELVFRDELWPDSDRAGFAESLAELTNRRRRFGGRVD